MGRGPRRPSLAALRVLQHMMEDPSRTYYGLELMDHCSISSGTLYPLLARWRDQGWVRHHIEPGDPSELGRAPRTYYELTASGAAAAAHELNAARARGVALA